MEGKDALIRWDSFSRELDRARTLGRVKELADKARAVEVYCKNAKTGLPAVNKAIMWWVRSARKAGGILAGVERTPAGKIVGRGRPKDSSLPAVTSYQKVLKENGLVGKTAHVWQQLAKIPEKDFEKFLAKFKVEVELLSLRVLENLLPKGATVDPPLLPPGKYRLLYADPPWEYEFSASENRRVQNKYPVLSVEDICNYTDKKRRTIKSLAAEDAVLFLWATSPKLPEGLEVLNAWGFEYKTCMIWVKNKIGMGYYARQKHELLLIGAKGNLGVPAPHLRPYSVVIAERKGHSEKPDIFYKIIETMYPFKKIERIELFARRPRQEWTQFGSS